MVRLEIEACDICADPYRPTREVGIWIGEEQATGHLCEEHVISFTECLRQLESPRGTKTSKTPSKALRSKPRAAEKVSSAKPRVGRQNRARLGDIPVLTEEQARKLS